MSEDRKVPFSEREGHVPPKPIQVKNLDKAVRARLWSIVLETFPHVTFDWPTYFLPMGFLQTIWRDFLSKPIDDLKNGEDAHYLVRNLIMTGKWFRAFDFLEYVLDAWESFGVQVDRDVSKRKKLQFVQQCNTALAKENAGYRITDDLVVPIVSDVEVQSIDKAIHGKFGRAGKHIKKALALFSNRENPDYANSMKESAMAIQAISLEITNQKKISMTMKKLVDGGMQLHPAFLTAIVKLYGFASDEDGVRHAGAGEPLSTDQTTALFMLVTCSAFVNYITAEHPNINPRTPPRR